MTQTDYPTAIVGKLLEKNARIAELEATNAELLEALELAVALLSEVPHEPAMKIATAIAKARGNPA